MDFEALVHTRKSVRGFKEKPVPRAVIEEIIEIAKRAPSSMNTQPWHVHVLTGEPLEQVRRRNMEEMIAGAKPKRDIVSRMANIRACIAGDRSTSPRNYSARWVSPATTSRCGRIGCCAASGNSMRRCRWCWPMTAFSIPVRSAISISARSATASCWRRGIAGSARVINGQGITRSDIVREVAGIPEDQVIMTCVAMGYPDDEFAANSVKSDRQPNSDFVRYVGFSD